MPWLPLYIDRADAEVVLQRLNQDEELAFLVSDGPKKWKAVRTLGELPDRDYSLWHTPGAPLPMLVPGQFEPDGFVEDPWTGWTERVTGLDPTIPFFGAGHPSHIIFSVCTRTDGTRHQMTGDVIGLSGFQWIGERYASTGGPAAGPTKPWWNRLRHWVSKSARKIPRSGPVDGPRGEIWAFPSALQSIAEGKQRAPNPL
jgi:hypothetical protein